jgi:hypothetical protein
MAEETTENQTNISDLAQSIEIGKTNLNFSDIIPDNFKPPSFSSLDRESLDAIEETIDTKSTEAVDKTIIKSITDHNQIQQHLMMEALPGTQPSSPHAGDIKSREHDLFNSNAAGFPNEMATEKLPPNMGGAIPRSSSALQRLKTTSADIKSGGNKYGYA